MALPPCPEGHLPAEFGDVACPEFEQDPYDDEEACRLCGHDAAGHVGVHQKEVERGQA